LGPTLPALAGQTGVVLSQISYLFTVRSLGYMIGSLFSGRLYDRLPGHGVMIGGLAVIVFSMALVPVVHLLWLLILIMLVIGLAEGAQDVGGNTLLVWVFRDKVGPFMNALHFFFGVGAFMSPIIIAWAVQRSGGISWAYWILALLALPPAAWLLSQSSPVAEHAEKDAAPIRVDYAMVILAVACFFSYVGAEVGFGGWVYTYALKLELGNETTAAYLTSAFWGALTAGRFLAIPIAMRFRPRTILISDLVGCLVSVLIILAWPASETALWIGTIGLGVSMASVFPTTILLAERRMTITGQVTSFFLLGASLGGMFLPWLIGQLFEPLGPQVTMIIILAVAIYLVFIFVPKKRAG
jgi:FHS family Na+ dependent glucose MFS transporter 1